MLEDMLTRLENKLTKGRMGWGESVESEARGVSRGEALEIIKLWRQSGDLSFDKFNELHARTQTLKDDPTLGISPFNSSFYVVGVDPATRTGIRVEIRGRGKIGEVLLAFANCLLREVYQSELSSSPVNQYRGLIMRQNEQVGDAFYVGSSSNLLVIRLEKWHKRISMKFKRSRVWTIGVEILCSLKVKHELLPALEKLHGEYELLRSTRLKYC